MRTVENTKLYINILPEGVFFQYTNKSFFGDFSALMTEENGESFLTIKSTHSIFDLTVLFSDVIDMDTNDTPIRPDHFFLQLMTRISIV